MSKPKLGSGKRFAALKSKLAGRKGVRNSGALAAFIGRKKYGPRKMASLAKGGKRRMMLHAKIARGMDPTA